ncbi:bifunctional tRNA (5-methylaminomethyl-2-thiouridine)(34)-methyltransferase MnmD/FAD-dependent 5-carboxymethylaminomethyl-2-thiouridine(34) oxidoreductase MnmC [Sodalis praecaptivus]|uniref:bifunctional tRNA (5-methylaminomethyl-2-thiouridine)(34)-methyltransferase MnmD/FAD-dependent 5-carboxymethylaminomethyl-2-thiouridine(34) oxidoreductase MnmC n=1 Tax=Sodalis praecaptivus TaxID=1239307 RepID=UPI0027F4A97A|nr:bifunctional tRNA (5-methylaminomethyl-2-thiouridine)(34)-methyltransferase MnmD/FAD-dependent 5-carboxymethylaminomethyl-2-thiouridine(34) oxidoreductase MnmC [Sodalis praecaptivus]CAJ0995101.1 tRNA 5-methylaminomethyl-2-thiouridine biosynthesis bifunctional protein MnmC [Sodalis praecaptivus]
MNRHAIVPAVVRWNEQGTPVSQKFDDVYFSNQDGLAETRHVFLNGNGLPARFSHHPRPVFRVAETGFGTGLNFLALWHAFDQHCRQQPITGARRLHFISFEKFPFAPEDLRSALEPWEELAPLARELQTLWPQPLAGYHRLELAHGRVILDIGFGDVNALIPTLDPSLDDGVDAWFLDGFAPAKNPDMWQETLFAAMARLAAPTGSFATFTAAGFVRRGLQQAGFAVMKVNGFGRKREMLTGTRLPRSVPGAAPWYARPAAAVPDDVAIIGGGIASALTALALQRRGARVTLYCADGQPAQGASGNRQGALYPLLNHRYDALAQFYATAFPYALRCYQQLAAQGVVFEHHWCGVTQLAWDEKSAAKIAQILGAGWPTTLVRSVTREDMAALVGVETGRDGLMYPAGGWLNPAQLTAGALQLAARQGLQTHYRRPVNGLSADGSSGWGLRSADGVEARHATVVLANGQGMSALASTALLPLYAVRGQVSHIPATAPLAALRQVLCFDGYLTPQSPGNASHCLGASYQRGDAGTDYRESEQQQNLQRLRDCLLEAPWLDAVDISGQQARCGVRSAVRDHLPLVGNVPDFEATLRAYANLAQQPPDRAPLPAAPGYANLFMLGGLGSRGLCSAPLAAEIVAAQIFGEPLPVNRTVAQALNPNRFWIRKLLKGREIVQRRPSSPRAENS